MEPTTYVPLYVFLPSSRFQEHFIVSFMIISFDFMCVIFACCVVFIVCAVYFLCVVLYFCIVYPPPVYGRTAMPNSGDKIINQSINQSFVPLHIIVDIH